jgi:predicted O-methyltransferase YrrM
MKDLGYKRGIEIGVRRGWSAQLWIKEIPGLHLTAIDTWMPIRSGKAEVIRQAKYYETAKEKLAGLNVDIVRSRSRDAVNKFSDKSVDFVYIDADHRFDACMMDIIEYAPKVREGGMILAHDYCAAYHGGVLQAVNAYTYAHHIDPWYVTSDTPPTAFWERGAERVLG